MMYRNNSSRYNGVNAVSLYCLHIMVEILKSAFKFKKFFLNYRRLAVLSCEVLDMNEWF